MLRAYPDSLEHVTGCYATFYVHRQYTKHSAKQLDKQAKLRTTIMEGGTSDICRWEQWRDCHPEATVSNKQRSYDNCCQWSGNDGIYVVGDQHYQLQDFCRMSAMCTDRVIKEETYASTNFMNSTVYLTHFHCLLLFPLNLLIMTSVFGLGIMISEW